MIQTFDLHGNDSAIFKPSRSEPLSPRPTCVADRAGMSTGDRLAYTRGLKKPDQDAEVSMFGAVNTAAAPVGGAPPPGTRRHDRSGEHNSLMGSSATAGELTQPPSSGKAFPAKPREIGPDLLTGSTQAPPASGKAIVAPPQRRDRDAPAPDKNYRAKAPWYTD
jgi:hypothetical protein